MKKLIIPLISLFVLILSCQQPAAEQSQAEAVTELSQAEQIAAEVMEAMGGQAAWDNAQHFRWTFFGARSLVWDKPGGRVRIDFPSREMVMLLNLSDMSGQVQKSGEMLSEPDSLTKYLTQARNIWINDSYWLVMPFKLRDPGVTLTYVGEDTTLIGEQADVLSLTFEEVGVTPQNKYLVYVDKDRKLITQWDFYRNASDSTASFQSPWPDYKPYGSLLLSGGQSPRGGKITDIGVYESLPASVYDDVAIVDWDNM